MSFRRILCLFLLMMLLFPCALSEEAALSGYVKGEGYQYVTFGSYPYEEDGTAAPVIWRILGQGTPEENDLNNAANDMGRKVDKYATGDDLSGGMADVYCLMSEYIVDFVLYHDERDVVDGTPLDYVDTLMYDYMNGEFLNTLLTQEEQAVLVEMPQRGLMGLPTRKGELFRTDYGFVTEDFVALARRATQGTPYAYSLGLKRIKGNSWYWTTDWRAPGRRWIVGDNGHISVSGVDREGGVRAVCYVHMNQMDIIGGDGTLENPYQLAAKPAEATPGEAQ